MSTPVIELFTTPNKMTKTGKPERWRWRLLIDETAEDSSRGSFSDESAALKNATQQVRGFDKLMLRSPGQQDVPLR